MNPRETLLNPRLGILSRPVQMQAILHKGNSMRRPPRPFVVEIKHRRGILKRPNSIWGDINMSAIIAETTKDFPRSVSFNDDPVDSKVTPIDADNEKELQLERVMAGPQETELTQVTTEVPATSTAPAPKKKTPRPKRAKAEARQPSGKNGSKPTAKAADAPAPATRATRKTYSEKERAQKLAQIEKAIKGGASKKDAVAQAGISEQTYYHWKKTASPVSESDELKDLVALEEENRHLKKMLADRLRKENAELKSRLGLA
jgi:hypothetical protein